MSSGVEPATILAVDDQPEFRRRYEHRLGDDYEVLTANCGTAALDLLEDHVDIVLLDRCIPDMSGDVLLETIRSRDYDCRVTMVTTNEPDADIIELGYDAVLKKPMATTTLNDTVERLLARTAYETQLQELYSLCVQRAKARTDGGRPFTAESASSGRNEPTDLAALEDRIREIRETVDQTVDSFETTDYRASFRDLP